MNRTTTLNDIARALRLHPATVLRTVTGNPSASWSNPTLTVADVARAYGCRTRQLVHILDGADELLKLPEAAKLFGVADITLRKQMERGELAPVIRTGKPGSPLRFSRNYILAVCEIRERAA